jgi:hypothetical protein
LLLNAVNGVLAYCVIARISNQRDVALAAAALFTVHPTHVEAVVWISSRKELLFTTFLLLSTIAYVRARRDALLYRPAYLASIALFGLGLFSKTSISPYPLFFLLLDVAIDAHRPAPQRRTLAFHLATKLPYFALAVAWIAVNVQTQPVHPLVQRPFEYALVKGLAAWHYGALLFGLLPGQPQYDWPVFSYVPGIAIGPGDVAMALAPLVAVPLFVLLALWRRHTSVALALGWIIAGLLPPIGFPLIVFIGDRYLYAPSLGFCWLLALGMARLAHAMKSPGWRSAVFAAFLAATTLWFAKHTWAYMPVWRDSVAMWSYAADHSRYTIAPIGLVNTLREEGRLHEALAAANRVVARADEKNSLASPELKSLFLSARAKVLARLHRTDEAVHELERALELAPDNTDARDALERARERRD